jgi:phosphoribosylamine--glycine ligase
MNNVLVIGSGGREHALCWRLAQSPSVAKVFCSPGNGGIGEEFACVALASHAEIIDFCKKERIALVVIGPEQPLVEGLADALAAAGIAVFGPQAKAARLEGSKGFMKELCKNYHIPTAAYGFFDNVSDAKQFLEGKSYPIVVKADGLAAGKGVIIAQDKAEALAAIDDMFSGKIAGGAQVVIEEFLEGEEVSFFALCDGDNAVAFGSAQDHKRAYDGDKGPNTGGMGTYAPLHFFTDALQKTVMETIIFPTVAAMKKEGCPFKGVLFAGLMLTKDGPKLLEYNVRFGDPETQVLMARFEGDLYALLLACSTGRLAEAKAAFGKEAAICVVMAAKGYPGAYEKNTVIKNLGKAGTISGVKIFHAGTKKDGGEMLSVGGRVLGITATGDTLKEAQARAYQAIDLLDWPQGFCRRDIGWRGVKGMGEMKN